MEPTLHRALDFKMVFDVLADERGIVHLQVLSSHWPSDEARPSCLPRNCLSLWSQLADANGYLDWAAFSKGITNALITNALELSNETSAPPPGTDWRLQNLREEKRELHYSVSAVSIEGFLKSCGKDELIRALLNARKEVYNFQRPSLQAMNVSQKGDRVTYTSMVTNLPTEQKGVKIIADVPLIDASTEVKEVTTEQHAHKEAYERFSQLSVSLSKNERERSYVPSEHSSSDTNETEGAARTHPRGTPRSRKDDAVITHAQLSPVREASELRLSHSTMTLPRNSTYSRHTHVQDSPHGETETHLLHHNQHMTLPRRPSPSQSPVVAQNSLQPVSMQAINSDLPRRQHVRHSSVTIPHRTSSESPVTMVTPTATDESTPTRAQQRYDSEPPPNAAKAHRRSHSLVGPLATMTTQGLQMAPTNQPGTKVVNTRTPKTGLTTSSNIALDSGPITDL